MFVSDCCAVITWLLLLHLALLDNRYRAEGFSREQSMFGLMLSYY